MRYQSTVTIDMILWACRTIAVVDYPLIRQGNLNAWRQI